ncbi:DUF2384 domain-containing protein [Pseudomonas sp. MPFS]|uniref:antitoxin Xre/MbcA/ParS toxin-binding domain-containing protein n=1 Tax=Pseudomonas sp. MPFS TaxID=2795724 RepID=UPI001F12ACA6|nr:antitoxin Xre/MbcA/ParS toxin-binding domain-containing protein [Pseudomonas sp. MPFS]UMZ11904.1 DUF2384 domain-containing protein [Pseudomonas sp. MPFS]
MRLSSSHPDGTASPRLTPSQSLFQSDPDELGAVAIYLRIAKGFDFSNAQALLRESTSQSQQIMSDLLGVPVRIWHTQRGKKSSRKLTPGQSALMYQYAKLLELAEAIFGSRLSAEQWLCSPCRHLDHTAPMTMINNAIGYQTAVDYLKRIRHGVYQ